MYKLVFKREGEKNYIEIVPSTDKDAVIKIKELLNEIECKKPLHSEWIQYRVYECDKEVF